MKLLANENYPIVSIQKLRNEGFDVESVAELMQGEPDTEVLKYAARQGRFILTFDKD